MKLIYYLIVIVGLQCVNVSWVKAQSFPIRSYSVDDGLISNIVYDCEQDLNGVIWFSTSAGISKYDGKRWTSLSVDDGLSNNEVLKIKKDLNGNLWALNFNGTVNVIKEDTIINENNNAILKQLGPGFYYKNLYASNDGAIWLSNRRNVSCKIKMPNSITHYTDNSVTIFATNTQIIQVDSLGISTQINQLMNNKNGKQKIKDWYVLGDSLLFALTDSNIVCVDKKNGIKKFHISLPINKRILDFYIDNNKELWITYENEGVFYYIQKGNTYSLEKQFLKDEYITSTFKDNENNIWFTTYGKGVFMIPANYKTVYGYTKNDNLIDNEVYSILVDKKNRIWVGHKYCQIDLIVQNKVQHIKLLQKNINIGRCIKMLEHPAGYVFVATDFGVFKVNVNNPTKNIEHLNLKFKRKTISNAAPVKDITIAKNGDVLIVTQEAIHLLPDSKVHLANQDYDGMSFESKRYFSAFQENNGVIWYSDFDGLKSNSNGKIASYENEIAILKNPIIDMCMYQHKLFLTLHGDGVVILENGKLYKQLTTKDGLLSNQCGRLFVNNISVFVSSNLGLNMITLENDSIKSISKITLADGLLSNQVNELFVNVSTIYCATLKAFLL